MAEMGKPPALFAQLSALVGAGGWRPVLEAHTALEGTAHHANDEERDAEGGGGEERRGGRGGNAIDGRDHSVGVGVWRGMSSVDDGDGREGETDVAEQTGLGLILVHVTYSGGAELPWLKGCQLPPAVT